MQWRLLAPKFPDGIINQVFGWARSYVFPLKCQLACLQAPTNVNIVLFSSDLKLKLSFDIDVTLGPPSETQQKKSFDLVSPKFRYSPCILYFLVKIISFRNLLSLRFHFKLHFRWRSYQGCCTCAEPALRFFNCAIVFLCLCLYLVLFLIVFTVAFSPLGLFLLIFSPSKPLPLPILA